MTYFTFLGCGKIENRHLYQWACADMAVLQNFLALNPEREEAKLYVS